LDALDRADIHKDFVCGQRSRTCGKITRVSLSIAASLVWWRLVLPRRFEQSSLDALLEELDGGPRSVAVVSSSLAAKLQRVERWIDRVPSVPKTCLYRAMARFATLRACGVDAVFFLGWPRHGEGHGHAWVAVAGEPWLEDEDLSSMTVTFCYPPRARTSAPGAQRSAS
jgi:hypothetical protein